MKTDNQQHNLSSNIKSIEEKIKSISKEDRTSNTKGFKALVNSLILAKIEYNKNYCIEGCEEYDINEIPQPELSKEVLTQERHYTYNHLEPYTFYQHEFNINEAKKLLEEIESTKSKGGIQYSIFNILNLYDNFISAGFSKNLKEIPSEKLASNENINLGHISLRLTILMHTDFGNEEIRNEYFKLATIYNVVVDGIIFDTNYCYYAPTKSNKPTRSIKK